MLGWVETSSVELEWLDITSVFPMQTGSIIYEVQGIQRVFAE